MRFIHRQRVRWKDDEGFVNFVDEELITICVHEWEKTPELAQHSVQKMNQVNVVCHKEYWGDVQILEDK